MSININHRDNSLKLDTGLGVIGNLPNACHVGASPFECHYPAGVTGGLGTLTTLALTANSIYAVPFMVGRPCTTDQLSMVYSTANGTYAEMAIYSSTSLTNVYPNARLLTGVGVVPGGGGVKHGSYATTLQPGQLYWLAIVCDGDSITAIPGTQLNCALGMNATLSGALGGLFVANGSTTLPVTFPGSATLFYGPAPLLTYRLSA